MSFSDVVRANLTQSTECCNTINVQLLQSSILESSDALNGLSVALDYPPSADVTVHLVCLHDADIGDDNYQAQVAPFFTTSLSFTSSSTLIQVTTGLKASAIGKYSLGFETKSSSADEYSISYTNNQFTFDVISSQQPISAPVLSTAAFSSDGLTLSLAYNAPTDRNGISKSFSCSALFSFPGATLATCV